MEPSTFRVARAALPLLLAACGQASLEPEAVLETSPKGQEVALAPDILNVLHKDLSPQLATYVSGAGQWRDTPGMVAAVVKGEHLVAVGAAGAARRPATPLGGTPSPDASSAAMTVHTVFNIGSNTKSMSALLLSMLIEEHPALTWQTTLAEALPWADGYIAPEERKDVTLEQLVAHRSGFDCGDSGPTCTVSADCAAPMTCQGGRCKVDKSRFSHPDYGPSWKQLSRQENLVEFIRGPARPLDAPAWWTPSGFLADCIGDIGVNDYDNLNFSIVQAVIDQWAEMSFLDYAQSRLIDRYGMGRTFVPSQAWFLAQAGSIEGTPRQQSYWNPYFFQPTHPSLAAGEYAAGHGGSFEPVPVLDPDVNPWGISPASGGFAFDVFDWARYAIAHLRDRSPAVLATHQRPFAGYNFGWGTSTAKTPGGISYTAMCHNGGIDGANSRICVYPELDMAYLTFANGGANGGTGTGSANDKMHAWLRAQPAYKLDAGGCADTASVKGVQRFWSGDMFGCAGKVAFQDRASLCGAGYHVCSATEFVEKNTVDGEHLEAPKQHYWVDEQLGYGGSAGACWASRTGTSCGAGNSMRVCAPPVAGGMYSVDLQGNGCNWTGCGLGSSDTTSDYFGGCKNNPTAGTLCCRN